MISVHLLRLVWVRGVGGEVEVEVSEMIDRLRLRLLLGLSECSSQTWTESIMVDEEWSISPASGRLDW